MKCIFLFLLAAGPFVVRAQLRFDTLRLQPGSSLSVLLRPWDGSPLAPPRVFPWTAPAGAVRLLPPDRMPCLTVTRPVEPMPVDRHGNADRMVYRKRTWILVDSGLNH